MNFKTILETAAGVAIGMILAGIISKMIAEKQDNFDNE